MAMTSNKDDAIALKNEGNALLKKKNFPAAIKKYTEAIVLDPTNYVFYGNRAAAHLSLRKYEVALQDADKAIELNPEYSKAHGRKGLALFHLRKYEESKEVYTLACKLNPQSEVFKKQLQKVTNFLTISLPTLKERIQNMTTHTAKEADIEAREVLALLRQISDYDNPDWLETLGRVQAFLGRMCLARMAMGGAFEHFQDAIENLRMAKTETSLFLIADFEADYLLLKTKLQKEVKADEVVKAVKISEQVLGTTSLKHGSNLELLARIMFFLGESEKTVQMYNTALSIANLNTEHKRASYVRLACDKGLSDVYFKYRQLPKAAGHQRAVINNPACLSGDKAEAQFRLAMICKMLGQFHEAKRQLDLAVPVFEGMTGINRKTGLKVPHPKLPRMYVLQAELMLGENDVKGAEEVIRKADEQIDILGLKDLQVAVDAIKTKLEEAKKGTLPEPVASVVPVTEESDEEMELTDKYNATSVNADKTGLGIKRTMISPGVQFLGDGVEDFVHKNPGILKQGGKRLITGDRKA